MIIINEEDIKVFPYDFNTFECMEDYDIVASKLDFNFVISNKRFANHIDEVKFFYNRTKEKCEYKGFEIKNKKFKLNYCNSERDEWQYGLKSYWSSPLKIKF